ncbi:MAG: SpoIIE family protein phosphatase [Melioribacteraceae bacterium]|nr:SpoIIE family protein phosphatase [Melioribacteraceae bacterium]MCF8356342.1 SpoIIE family protein phosphatase [Melioribacteraceae bacterium]MCF8395751.1 SpoIIE family protein phosphatase [Melioribacteraceae bacterium]MCF8420553.1 SpoIIE family protein phosphatase [Melioribacteraceae bacterium]
MDIYLQIFFTTLSIAFCLLHFILFIYNRNLKSNLYFSLFLLFYAISIFLDYQANLAGSIEESLTILSFHRGVLPFPPIFALLFIYSAFEYRIPKQFWIISGVLLISAVLVVIKPIENLGIFQVVGLLVFFESVRVFIKAMRENFNDAWILTAGFLLLFIFSAYDSILDLDLIEPFYGVTNGYPFGFLMLILFSSIYLSRNFARRNRKILEHERKNKEMEISRRILEAQNARKAKELEEARQVQLSLLPQCISKLGDLEICFDMQTASEVGGDYYDFHLSEDNSLTIVIGDATDHGMKAGMMVSIIKSLFLTHVADTDIIDFFYKCTNTIKQMKLKNLYMALLMMKIRGNNITFSSAGMPPVLVYRNSSDKVEEHKLKGMPIGAVKRFPYQIKQVDLYPGDVVLLMSDGLPELFDENKNSFGYRRVKEVLKSNHNLSADEIVQKLFTAGKEWRSSENASDDITFVALKLKNSD